jgi:DNA-binding FadR family transcriptional regulator
VSKQGRIQITRSPQVLVVTRSTFSKRSLHGQTATTLGRKIASGEFPEGSLLPLEADLLELFDCSRSVLREAILVLTAKGMLESRQRLGTRIRPRSEWSLLDPDVLDWVVSTGNRDIVVHLCEMRSIVEPAMAGLAAIQGSDENITAISEALRLMYDNVESLQDFIPHDLAFHENVFGCSDNPFMGALSGIVRDAVLTVMVVVQVPEDLRRARLELHRDIYEAIAAHDQAASVAAMSALVDVANNDLLTAIDNNGGASMLS